MVIYGTPILYKPDKHYILTVQNINEKEEEDMIWKWIKAIFIKPLTILKSIYFNIFGKSRFGNQKVKKIVSLVP